MSKYIDADKLIAEIERLKKRAEHYEEISLTDGERSYWSGESGSLELLTSFITSLQHEQPDVDLEKLGGIARHLIAVKDHEEDMRLDEGEWLLLEKIGYPERFNARKE